MNKLLSRSAFTRSAQPAGPRPGDDVSEEQRRHMSGPIRTGLIVIGIFFVGMLIWAALAKVAGGVPAPGVVAVENNRKTVQHLDGGIVREIKVHEGDLVRAGQVLFVFDDNGPRAQVEVLKNQYQANLAERARLEAEAAGARSITWPAELTSTASDPQVATYMRDQENLFRAGLSVYESQVGVLNQRAEQYRRRLEGLSAQIDSLGEQAALIDDELQGVASLEERGFAPKSRLLALQRNAAALAGDRGARISDQAGVREAIGETQIQLAEVRQQRTTQAAAALRETQAKIADVVPRLTAAEEVLSRTVVRAPVDGYVLGLTQFTEGGVAGPGQRLLDIVPLDAPLVIKVKVRPDHIDEIRTGMTAQVRITAFTQRTAQPLDAKVTTISADLITPTDGGAPYFEAQLVVPPSELKKLPKGTQLSPGMPAMAMIVTGERSVLDYIVSPVTDTIRDSMHEQ